jgi:hypothetical protein
VLLLQGVARIKTASVRTEVWDGFAVVRTSGLRETFQEYRRLTAAIQAGLAWARRCFCRDLPGVSARRLL